MPRAETLGRKIKAPPGYILLVDFIGKIPHGTKIQVFDNPSKIVNIYAKGDKKSIPWSMGDRSRIIVKKDDADHIEEWLKP